jgi:peptide/nickel transport system substrate-binding protein
MQKLWVIREEQKVDSGLDRSDGGADLTRRKLLAAGGGLALAAAGGGILAGCGSGSSSASSQAKPGGPPTRGGTLRVGMLSGGPAETMDVSKAYNTPDIARVVQVYDTLYTLDTQSRIVPQLVKEAEPNKDGSAWTIRVHEGVSFHDGKELTADDVIWTVKTWTNPTHYGYPVGAGVEPKTIKKLDKYTCEIPLKQKQARWPEQLAGFRYNLAIIPNGSDPSSIPPGTGPFYLKSFTPGQRSVMLKNDEYWEHGSPLLDGVEIITTFTDDTSRYNALLGGQIDVIAEMSFLQAKTATSESSINLLQAPSPSVMCFYMDTEVAPFNDVRVRQALKLMLDREQLVESVLLGFGKPGNDLFAVDLPFYAGDLVREQDVEQAKSLLKQAGQENLAITLKTSKAFSGASEAAPLFQQQAEGIGVKVNIEQVPSNEYFNAATIYLKMPLAESYFTLPGSIAFPWGYLLQENSPANETHWNSKKSDELAALANATFDNAKATEYWHEAQEMQFNEGGYIWWGNYDNLDATASNVYGLPASKAAPCDYWNFRRTWLG